MICWPWHPRRPNKPLANKQLRGPFEKVSYLAREYNILGKRVNGRHRRPLDAFMGRGMKGGKVDFPSFIGFGDIHGHKAYKFIGLVTSMVPQHINL